MSTLPDGFLAQEFSSSDELAQTPSSEYQLSLFCDTMANVPDDIARPSSTGDLTDRAVLDKIDHVRRLGIDIPLPQIVVVGAQSSGKSSTLESITGFRFPHGAELCTRFATEISCRREDTKSITVSIRQGGATCPPSPRYEKIKAFRRKVESLNEEEFARLFQEAAEVMGLDPSRVSENSGQPAFSRDVFQVEICGPNEDHLTVIDVPGIFEYPRDGVTTKADIKIVDNMVKDYIQESRTIILAVVPCNADIANQKILQYSKEVDPQGRRTLGVLTKPDLLLERNTRQPVLDLVNGKRRDLALGYHIIRNRGADDKSTSKEKRDRDEEVFFDGKEWKDKVDKTRVGVPALKAMLKSLLLGRTKEDLPSVKKEIAEKLRYATTSLEAMGDPRTTPDQQRDYLSQIAEKFRVVKTAAVDGSYSRTEFSDEPHLRLITRVRKLNESFSTVFYARGHTRNFLGKQGQNGSDEDEVDNYDDDESNFYPLSFDIPTDHCDEIDDILAENFEFPLPEPDGILDHIDSVHAESLAWDLGTFNPDVLRTTFREQTSQWEGMTLTHVSNAILVVHHFIRDLVELCCPDDMVRRELWNHVLDEVIPRYRRAMEQARFLLSVERDGRPLTVNPEFRHAKKQADVDRAKRKIKNSRFPKAKESGDDEYKYILTYKALTNVLAGEAGDAEESQSHIIHDVLKSYYGVARSRFVDAVCQQAVDRFLVSGKDGPLQVVSERWVNRMKAADLERIAGEAQADKNRRKDLEQEIERLKKARSIILK